MSGGFNNMLHFIGIVEDTNDTVSYTHLTLPTTD